MSEPEPTIGTEYTKEQVASFPGWQRFVLASDFKKHQAVLRDAESILGTLIGEDPRLPMGTVVATIMAVRKRIQSTIQPQGVSGE